VFRYVKVAEVAISQSRTVTLSILTLLTLVHRHKHVEPPKPGEGYRIMEKTSNDRLSVTFVTPEGDRTTLQVAEGDSLLDIAHEHDIDLEGSRYGSPI